MKAHDGVRFAVVEGAFLPDAFKTVETLVVKGGGTCAKAAHPPPNTDFVIVPRHAQAADAKVVRKLLDGSLDGWKDITLVTAEWIELSAQMTEKFEELWKEYKIGGSKDVRSQLDFHRPPMPINNDLIVNVEDTKPQTLGDDRQVCLDNGASLPSTPDLREQEEDPAVEATPRPGYPFPSAKAADPTSSGTRSPPSEFGSTLSAPPTPTKGKSKNAQRKAARKRAKKKKKSLNVNEPEETEGDESTTTDQSKSQEQELTVWDRIRNLKKKGETLSSVTDRESERLERERRERVRREQETREQERREQECREKERRDRERRERSRAETPMGNLAQAIQIHKFDMSDNSKLCNWCDSVHDQMKMSDIWERVADDVFPKHSVKETVFVNNAISNRTCWERCPRREEDKQKLAWENIRDAFTPSSPKFFTDELFDAYIRCLNDQLEAFNIKALVLGTNFWDALVDECLNRHPMRLPLSQFVLLRTGYSDLSMIQYDRIIFPVRVGHVWSVAILDIENHIAMWYDAFGCNKADHSIASKVGRIIDVLIVTDPDVGDFGWKLREIHELPVHGPANYSGVHSALTCEILARQGMQNDHLIQWLMVEFRRTMHCPAKTEPEGWLKRAIRWVIYVCGKGEYMKDAWDADVSFSQSQDDQAEEVKGLEISGISLGG